MLTEIQNEMIFYNNQSLIKLVPIVSPTFRPSAVEALPPRVLGLHEGQGWMSEEFNDSLPDEFWLGE